MDELKQISNKLEELNNSTSKTSDIFWALLTILFIAFKLLGVINWSWWWVLAPLWIPSAVVLAILIILAIVVGIAQIGDKL